MALSTNKKIEEEATQMRVDWDVVNLLKLLARKGQSYSGVLREVFTVSGLMDKDGKATKMIKEMIAERDKKTGEYNEKKKLAQIVQGDY